MKTEKLKFEDFQIEKLDKKQQKTISGGGDDAPPPKPPVDPGKGGGVGSGNG